MALNGIKKYLSKQNITHHSDAQYYPIQKLR